MKKILFSFLLVLAILDSFSDSSALFLAGLPWVKIGSALVGGLLGSQKKGASKETQNTKRDPWEPSIEDLKYAQTEARRLYDERGNLIPPPERDFSSLWDSIPGSARTNDVGSGGGSNGSLNSGKTRKGGGGRGSKYSFNAPGFGGGVDELNKDYRYYMDGGGLDFSTDAHAALRERIEREMSGIHDRRRDDVGAAFDLSGMTSSTLMGNEMGAIEKSYSDSVGDRVLDAALGLREQNMGLLSHFGGLEQAGIAAADSSASSRYGSDQARKATLGAARIGANASMHNARLAAGESRAAREAADKKWAWNARLGLTNSEHEDDLRTWGFNNTAEGAALDDLIRRSTNIGSMGGTGETTSVNRGTGGGLADIVAGGLGGWLTANKG